MTLSPIAIHDLRPRDVASLRRRVAREDVGRVGAWLREVAEAVAAAGATVAGPPFVRTHAVSDQAFDLEVGWPVAAPFAGHGAVGAATLPGGRAAVVTYTGPYHGLAEAHAAVTAWCARHGHEIVGAPWESYLTDPEVELDPAHWRTDVCYPVAG